MFMELLNHTTRLRLRAASLICVSALLVAGCASAETTDSADGGKDAPIKVGVIADVTGATSVYSASAKAVELAADRLNKSGGINGRQVHISVCDSQALPDQVTRCARKMLSEKVVAVIGGGILGGVERIYPILEPANIPYLPAASSYAADLTAANSFPLMSNILAIPSMAWLGAKQGCKNHVIVTFETGTTAINQKYMRTGAKAGGGDAPTFVTVQPNTTDWAPVVAQVVAKNPDCIGAALSEVYSFQFFPALEQSGWKDRSPNNRIMGYYGGTYTTAHLKDFSHLLDNAMAVNATLPLTDPSFAEFVEISNEMRADPSIQNVGSAYTRGTYALFRALQTVVGQIQEAGEPVTSETIKKTFETSKSIDTIYAGNWSMVDQKAGPVIIWPRLFSLSLWVEEIHDGKITPIELVDLAPDFVDVFNEEFPNPL